MKPQIPPAIGDVLLLEEPNYLPGVGLCGSGLPLWAASSGTLTGRWLTLRGVALGTNGALVNGRERYVLVRLEALHRRAPGEGQS